MIPRPQAGAQRPAPPQSAGGTGPHRPLNRPTLPSKLSNVSNARPVGPGQHASALPAHAPAQTGGSGSASGSGSGSASQQPGIKQEAVAVKTEGIRISVGSTTKGGNEVPSADSRPNPPHSQPAESQSSHRLESGSFPPPTPPISQLPKQQTLPLPARPSFLADVSQQPPRIPDKLPRTRLDPSRRSSGLRAPAMATPLPRGKVADFFPWTGIAGAHSEDVLNDLSVRNGGSDKGAGPGSPAVAQESNTARPNLWPQLKSKQGMHIISNLFCQVLEKRQQMGRCTAPSTFKPPPRVTLTDSKREAWLKDLANPDVPLRRLSRTIPHGIRGKVLLDHCISKQIPLARAVWLSKCVGANEIRAFKRKGVSGSSALAGEVKWIRDWTTNVEDFIQGIIEDCGQPGWSKKMNYAIRLATYFFSEHLLDSDHYIDWLLLSLRHATTERLPIWILLTQVYWKNLVSQRRRGRTLSEALAAHARNLTLAGHHSNGPLLNRIEQLISILAIAHQGCLVMPKSWTDHAAAFDHILTPDRFAHSKDAMLNVRKRNIRMIRTSSSAVLRKSNSKQALTDMLDAVGLDGRIPTDALPCDGSLQNLHSVLTVVLVWATSPHGQGMSRVFLASRIIISWNRIGADTDGIILRMLEESPDHPNIDANSLYRIVALLASSGHFSVSKYLQWLISVGALSGIPAVPNDTHLLLELPTDRLPSHVSSLRGTILARMGYGSRSEIEEIDALKASVMKFLQSTSSDLRVPIVATTGTVKLAVAHWLCEKLVVHRDTLDSEDVNNRIFTGTLREYCFVRKMLELYQDFSSLAKIVRAASSSTAEATFLATISDTINMHAGVFAAMGALDDLVNRLCMQQQDLRRRLPLDKTFLQALSSLVQHVPSAATFRESIATDLQYCETQNSVAACSPASDSMITNAGRVPESNEDISRVLASGNTMDEHLFTRMFDIIVDRAMKTRLEGMACTGAWFSQLRRFDPATFDQLLQTLLGRMKESSVHIPAFIGLTASLVGSGCMKMEWPFRMIEGQISTVKEQASANHLAKMALGLVLPLDNNALSDSPELYKFQLEQKLFRDDNAGDVASLMFAYLGGRMSTPSHEDDDKIISFLRQQLTRSKSISDDIFSKIDGSTFSSSTQDLLDRLMSLPNPGKLADATTVSRMRMIIASANENSLRFCKLALKVCFASTALNHDEKIALLQVFQDAIEHDNSVWPELMTALDEKSIYQIHTWARDRGIVLMSEFVSSVDSRVKIEEIRRYLAAADITSFPAEAQGHQPQTLLLINDHLAAVSKLIDEMNTLDVAQAPQRQRIAFGLEVLLQLAARHSQTTDDNTSSQEITAMTQILCLLLIHPKLQNQRGALEYILDVVSVIVDDLSPDVVVAIVRNLPTHARTDPRIKYLFGITTSPDSWLALASKVYPQPPPPQPQPTQASTPSSLPRATHPLPPRTGGPTLQRTSSNSSIGGGGVGSTNGVVKGQPPPQQPAVPPTRAGYEIKYNAFQLRRWEIMPDPTPNMGVNDTALSLGLFQARKVV